MMRATNVKGKAAVGTLVIGDGQLEEGSDEGTGGQNPLFVPP